MNKINVRYARQRYSDDCTLATTANLIKHSGIKFSYRDHFDELADIHNYESLFGVRLNDVKKFFKQQTLFKYKYRRSPSVSNLKNQLKKGPVHLTYNTLGGFHTVLVVKDYNFGFTVVNENRNKGETITNMPVYFMKELLVDSYAFFVDKK